ncbi:MAG: DM13 domain-containing protein, partial [Myxococcales bacterium]|nr:DM13 domain-containing protein [Myxococcales bacterium]
GVGDADDTMVLGVGDAIDMAAEGDILRDSAAMDGTLADSTLGSDVDREIEIADLVTDTGSGANNDSNDDPSIDGGSDLTADGADDVFNGGEGDGTGCGSTHPHIGWVADLETHFHGVSGRATIVDDCTIEITNFNFDGGGVDVRVYGANDGNYETGFPMTEDLHRAEAYVSETVIAVIPDGRSLDDVDGISVWCIDFTVDFGSGLFAAPE